MNYKNKIKLKFLLILSTALLLPAGVFLVQKILRPKPQAQVSIVNYYLEPSTGDLANGTSMRLMVNPSSQRIVFIKAVINFEPNKIQLSSEVNVASSAFSTVVRKSTIQQANETGRIDLVLAAPPGSFSPATAFELVNFTVDKTTLAANTPLAISISETQTVNEDGLALASTIANTSYTLNPSVPVTQIGCVNSLNVNDTANAADWRIKSNLQTGDIQFGDRTYILNAVPQSYSGTQWIQTANDSKIYTGATVATFNLSSNATVYIAHDDRVSVKPSWLNGWVDTGANIVNSETTPTNFSLYSKAYPAGTVSLGNNGATGFNMYTVIIACGQQYTAVNSSVTPTVSIMPLFTIAPIGPAN